jgi:hypothetical protein
VVGASSCAWWNTSEPAIPSPVMRAQQRAITWGDSRSTINSRTRYITTELMQRNSKPIPQLRRLYVKPSCVIAIVIVWIPYRRGYLITMVVGNEWIKQQFLSRDDCTLDSWAGFIALWRPSWASWCVIIVSYSTLHTICYYPCSCSIPT